MVRGELTSEQTGTESCVFSGRCWLRADLGNPEKCVSERPTLRILENGHVTACHFAEQVEQNASVGSGSAPK